MNPFTWLGWTWLLVVAAQGLYLIAEFFLGPWTPPFTARLTSISDGAAQQYGDTTVLGLVIALVVANSLFMAGVRQLGEDKPAITKLALFLAAVFVLAGAFIALYASNPILAALMLFTAGGGIVAAFYVVIVTALVRFLFRP